MDLSLIKLQHLSPLHLGNGTEAYENSETTIHSDTLVAALASLRAAEGKTDDLQSFIQSFAMSNTFPYIEDTYFLLAPKGKLPITVKGELNEAKIRKTLKKIAFIDSQLFDKLAAGNPIEIHSNQIQGAFLFALPQDAPPKIMETQVTNRVSVSRNGTQDAQPFPFEWTYIAENAGLYFLTDATGALLNEIIHLTTSLGREGLGTDRSVGGGHFNVATPTTYHITTPNNPTQQLILSFYIPTKEELQDIDLRHSRYQLIERSGYMSGSSNFTLRHLRRKHIFGFAAGSVLTTNELLAGKVVDVRPEWNAPMHPVYRSGKALTIPITLKL